METTNGLKGKILKIVLIFLGLMLLLTMMSKTIYTLLLPQVMVDESSSGAVSTGIYSKGKLGFDRLMIDKMQVVAKAPKEGQVIACYVQEGDLVKKGDALLEIQGEVDEDGEVEKVQARKEVEININAYNREKEKITRQYESKKEELAEKQKMLQDFTDDYEIIDLEEQILQKQEEVTMNDALFDAGGITQSDRDASRNSLQLLQEKCNFSKKEHDKKLEEDIKDIQEEMNELKDSLLQQDERIEIEENKLGVLKDKESKKTVCSPIDGIVYELKIGVGALTSQGEEMLVVIPKEIPITLTFRLGQEQADKLEIGSKVGWMKGQNQLNSEVIKKTYDEEKEDNIITCQVDQELAAKWITDYKTYKDVNISITHKSERYGCIVPTGAINYEGEQAYIYSVEEQDTVFEKKYIVHKHPIVVLEEGDEMSGVEGISQLTTIVLTTNKTLEDNAEVRLQ